MECLTVKTSHLEIRRPPINIHSDHTTKTGLVCGMCVCAYVGTYVHKYMHVHVYA